jgi:hypothetical protein
MEFTISDNDLAQVNDLLRSFKIEDSVDSVKEKTKNIPQPNGLGGKELIKVDKREVKKVIAHQFRIYLTRRDLKLVDLNDTVIDFWFKNRKLFKISSNDRRVVIPSHLDGR